MKYILSKILGFVFKKGIAKFFLFFGLYFLVAGFLPIIFEFIGGSDVLRDLSSSLSNIPSGVAYFLAPFRMDFAFKVLVTAYITRFLVRRIPLMG